jgi:SpoVK/Ycf46/Vps4 family AAA+-type ATPase
MKAKPLTLRDLSIMTSFSTVAIDEINELLLWKKQIIFYGPPGTGKTYFAKNFAQYFTGNVDNIEIIQSNGNERFRVEILIR